MKKVAVIDYGIGNLYSVQRALETCGADVRLVSDATGIDDAERLVLPGVGAFADGMSGLRERGLVAPLQRYADSGRPLLGICLGMQMLSTISEEFGEHAGLGLIPGKVVAIPPRSATGVAHKIPMIGWSGLEVPAGASWEGTPLDGVSVGTAVYHVHSFHVIPESNSHLLAEYSYGGQKITAAIRRGNIFGFQFHPEKSGPVGLSVCRNFVDGR